MPAFSPQEAQRSHGNTIPEQILTAVNEFLTARVHKSHLSITQQELVDALKLVGIDESEALEKGWFDFEELYRSRGWTVTYDKPAYNETYPARWVFQSK